MEKYQVLYVDTDGVYLGVSSNGESNRQEIIDTINNLNIKWQNELNYPEFELEIETSNFMFPVAHKNYLFGNLDDISIHGNNFSAKNKSKLSEITMKKVLHKSLKDIGDWSLNNKSEIRELVKNNILKFTDEEVNKINVSDIDVGQLVLYENVNPVSQYTKPDSIYALRTLAIEQLLNEKITHSTKLPMLVSKEPLPNISSDKLSKKNVKAIHYMWPLEYITKDKIDFEYYKDNIIKYMQGAFGLKKSKITKTKAKVLSKEQFTFADF